MDQLDIIRKDNAPPPAPLRDETGLPREVYALLAQANLLRMRGRWEESVDNCMAALRLAPDSPSAQSLLGDIYENQGRFDDAVQWYRMALDANPDSPADRLKLDRLLRTQSASRPDRRDATPDVPPDASAPAAPPLWRRLTHDPEKALRYGAVLAAVLVSLVVALAFAAAHRRAALAALGLGPAQEVRAAPVVVPLTSDLPAAAGAGDVARDSAEQAVLDTLRGSAGLGASGVTVNDVQFDPRTARMVITLSLSPPRGLPRAAVLRAALRAAQAGAAASPSAAAFTLRALSAPSIGSGDTLVFVGDLPQTVLPAAGAPDPDDDHVQALFSDPWWSLQVPA